MNYNYVLSLTGSQAVNPNYNAASDFGEYNTPYRLPQLGSGNNGLQAPLGGPFIR
jgi:hypothetical protein